MRCPVCNIEAAAGASFCPQCGAKLPLVEGAGSAPAVRQTLSGAASDSGTSSARGRSGDVPEEILWQGSYSPKAMVGSYVLGGVASLALIAASIWLSGDWYWMIPAGAIPVLWVVLLGKLAIQRLGVHYKLTNQMFYHQRGVLTRVTDRIELIEIHDVTYEQGLFDRMLNVGRVKIASNDRTDPVFYLRGIEDVSGVAQMIDKARRGEQVRRGRRIESLGVHES
jgi:membrane protein YdbS with pleckstrin-like domain